MDSKALYAPSLLHRKGITKTLLIMRLTGFLLLAACLQVSAGSFGQTVTLSVKAVPLARVLDQVKQQTGLSIFWDEQALKDAHPVTLDLKNATPEQALDACLRDQPLTYHIVENLVIIKPKVGTTGAGQSVAVSPPPGEIHGRVTDSLGNPLAGASVVIKGLKVGTETDKAGEFVLKNIKPGATIIISYTGYEAFEMRISGESDIHIRLKPAIHSLEDVVVNKGYYSTRQKYNTGNVSVVKGEDIREQP